MTLAIRKLERFQRRLGRRIGSCRVSARACTWAISAGPDLPAAGHAGRGGREGRVVLRHARRVPAGAMSIRRRSSATHKIPDEVVDGLKAIGALGMKVPEEYGGLGLSQVYYNRAMTLAGVWHSALSTLLSAHQSIGVGRAAAAVRLRGAEARVAAAGRTTTSSAFLLTEPDVGSDPARVATTADPDRGRLGLPAQRHASCGRPTARSPTSWS